MPQVQSDTGAGGAATSVKPRRWISVVLWVLAVLLMLVSAVYQRMTGPTHPLRGTLTIAGESARYKLLRSEHTDTNARIEIPDPSGSATGILYYKRYHTDDAYAPLTLSREHVKPVMRETGRDVLWAELPAQPPAGKLEYYLELNTSTGTVHVPDNGQSVVIRFKGRTPAPILIAHIFFMFFAVLWGIRALLEALFNRPGVRWLSWTTLGLLTIGGMILGPTVQHYAFGAAWTGIPFGWDLTDNKTLFMWLGWLIAMLFIGWGKKPLRRRGRWAALLAALLMVLMYVIPHSMYGSELDYAKIDQGADPAEAITQG
ncbi:hypothetical protein JW859_04460 [bacterium]|nr:hypothetical protein [bacterium]